MRFEMGRARQRAGAVADETCLNQQNSGVSESFLASSATATLPTTAHNSQEPCRPGEQDAVWLLLAAFGQPALPSPHYRVGAGGQGRVSLGGGGHPGVCSAGPGLHRTQDGLPSRMRPATWRHTRGNCQNPWPSGSFRPAPWVMMGDERGRAFRCLVTGPVTSQSGSQLARQPYRAGGTQAKENPNIQSQAQGSLRPALLPNLAGTHTLSPLQKW